MIVPIVLLIFHTVSSNACCTEGSTIIQIKNYEGPIYLHAPQTCEDRVLHHLPPTITPTGCDLDCTCVSKPVSSCVPINTASQCTTGLYNVPYPYQDVNAPVYSYNVPYSLYQDNQYYPVVQGTSQYGRQDASYVCGKCGRTYCY